MTRPFCALATERIQLENRPAPALRDRYPVCSGHTRIIPRRHGASFFHANEQARRSILELHDRVRAELDAASKPDRYRIGINDGSAAGQTGVQAKVRRPDEARGGAKGGRG